MKAIAAITALGGLVVVFVGLFSAVFGGLYELPHPYDNIFGNLGLAFLGIIVLMLGMAGAADE